MAFLSVTENRFGGIVLNQVGGISSSPARHRPFCFGLVFSLSLALSVVATISTEKKGA